MLGMSEAAVRMALSRARDQFRELYEREDSQEGQR
jgi:DNA-directed RNA polymerase specialized sigma24 family protein